MVNTYLARCKPILSSTCLCNESSNLTFIFQQLALDARQMSSALLRPEDRDAVLLATAGIVSSLETMLKTLKSVEGQPKETVKVQLSPVCPF